MTETGSLSLQIQAGASSPAFFFTLKLRYMNTQTAPTPAYLKTLVDCENKMRQDGYKENFGVKEDKLCALSTGKTYTPEETTIVNFFRFEGQSDPADNAIMYVIETKDGTKGTLVDGYGPSSEPDTSQFIVKVENIHKKANNTEKR
jgi:hypothetical protein